MKSAGAGPAPRSTPSRLLPAWMTGVGLGTWLIPGFCPACWPGYAGFALSAGLGVTAVAIPANLIFVTLLLLALIPLGVQISRRKRWDLVSPAVVGAALLAEARWAGGSALLQALGTSILLASALEALHRPASVRPRLIQITKENPSCERKSCSS